jgi:tripartite-type tricarboxylate transporter receptor subunit TctC
MVARLLVDKMREPLGWPQFNVDNRPGGAGRISVNALLQATDNRTVLITPLVTPVLSQIIFKNPGYDPGREFRPVGMIGHFQFNLAVSPNHPAKNMKEFAAWLKANRNQANFGSPSPGSLPHFFGVMLGRALGVEMQHVAYKGGSPMLTDLMSGQIPCGIDTQGEMIELHKAGRIRILASFAEKRTPQLPDVPTMLELGFKGASGSAWYSLWANARMPEADAAAINRALNRTLEMTEVKARLFLMGVDAAPSTPQALEEKRLADIAKWRPIIAASGFQAE